MCEIFDYLRLAAVCTLVVVSGLDLFISKYYKKDDVRVLHIYYENTDCRKESHNCGCEREIIDDGE